MNRTKFKQEKKKLRHQRVRAKIVGTKERPRVSVFRSNQHVSVQFIDDANAKTLLNLTDQQITEASKKGKTKTQISFILGKELGELAKKSGFKSIVFDRGGFAYHGRVKAVAEGLRETGLKF